MNFCYFQRWEESERGWGIRPDGCSLHLSIDNHRKYLSEVYDSRREGVVPNEYDRVAGSIIECLISDNLFDHLKEKKSIRLMEYEMNNLIKTEEIFLKM